MNDRSRADAPASLWLVPALLVAGALCPAAFRIRTFVPDYDNSILMTAGLQWAQQTPEEAGAAVSRPTTGGR